ncbi:MAG: phosphoribosyltransferase [Candidatus Bathyarchaeia archaeon]|jgi:predicted phosphoribosyltransferase
MVSKIIENLPYRDRVNVFQDRFEAGRLLAGELKMYVGNSNVIVLAIPAGGVPVGSTVAKLLNAKFDVVIVRKLQVPWNPEAGFGAVSWDGKVFLNPDLVEQLNLTKAEIDASILETNRNIEERLSKFRGDKPLPDLTSNIVILVDDGLASGYTMLAAAQFVKAKKPQKVVIAVPTASMGAIELLKPHVDEIFCLNIRSGAAFAVADAYVNWYDLTDEEVQDLLQ